MCLRLAVTVNCAGTIGPAATPSGDMNIAVDIQQLQPRGLQALEHAGREAPHELIAELVV